MMRVQLTAITSEYMPTLISVAAAPTGEDNGWAYIGYGLTIMDIASAVSNISMRCFLSNLLVIDTDVI